MKARSFPIVFAALLCLLLGTTPPPAARPLRVVSLAPNVTEMIYALGAGDRLAGVDDYSDVPPAAKGKPKVGGVEPSLERIVALHPDLVIASASSAHPALVKSLATLHIPLLVVATNRASDVGAAMETIGLRLGLANARSARFALDRALARERHPRARSPRVLFVAYTQPLYVAGRETFTGDILERCGAENAATVTGWPQYSVEALLANPPDIVLHPDQSLPRAQVVALFAKSPRQPEVVGVDENIFSRPGPRIVDAAAILNAILNAWESRHLIREPLLRH